MIQLELNQTRLHGGERLPKALLDRVVLEVSKELPVKQLKPVRIISVAFVSEKEMRKLNLQYRGKDRVTDVLSFTLDQPDSFGEIILSYEQAKRQAKTMKHSVRAELTFLLVHGLLHVFGHDHEVEKDAKKMFSLQTHALERLGINPKI